MTRIQPRQPVSLAACLAAAQDEAERLHGHGPVRTWQPSVDWRPWAVGAALATATSLVLLWPRGDAPPERATNGAAADQRVAIADSRATAPAPVTGAAAPAGVAPAADCDRTECPQAIAAPAPVPAAEPPALAMVLPDNMEAWALDPQPLALRGDGDDVPHAPIALANTPEVPDEHDATPAEESAPDEASFEEPAE